MGSPVLLFGTTTQIAMTAGVPSGSVAFPTANLVNRLAEPIEVHEFSLFSRIQSDAGGVAANANITRWERNVLLSLRAGRYAIMDRMPYLALAPQRDTDTVNKIELNGGTNEWVRTRRWILPRPMVLRAQESLAGGIMIDPLATGLTGTGFIEMHLVARARRIEGAKPSGARFIPYASGWNFRAFNTPAPDQTFQNVFNSKLHVTALTALAMTAASSDVVLPTSTSNAMRIVGPGGIANAVRRVIVDDVGTTGFFAQRNALELLHDLNPREFYQITMYGSGSFSSTFGVIQVGMHGYREEE